jgi:hypothetical protein
MLAGASVSSWHEPIPKVLNAEQRPRLMDRPVAVRAQDRQVLDTRGHWTRSLRKGTTVMDFADVPSQPWVRDVSS